VAPEQPDLSFEVDGRPFSCSTEGTLLDALQRDGHRSVKDGCSPQGQCGCCTVLVDGVARVACVTPVRRLAGRSVTTLAGVDQELLERLLAAFDATAASQCGFCTPGILVRLCGLARKGVPTEAQVRTALGAHLCRCTGFQPIVDAALRALDPEAALGAPRATDLASARASLESGTSQRAGRDTMLGLPGFAIDTAPAGTLVAVASADGGYALFEPSAEHPGSGKVQGRNSTIPLRAPVALPELSEAVLTLQTTFVEPGYVEPDASWCEPGGAPASAFSNAGAFGAKRHSPVMADARLLADQQGRAVLATWPREEVVRRGAKRPPISLRLRADGSGALRIGRTPDSDPFDEMLASITQRFPGLELEIVELKGPRIGATHRGAVIAELLAAHAVLDASEGSAMVVEAPNGAIARAAIEDDGTIELRVAAGRPLCEATLTSYVLGAVHQGLGMVESEGIAVDGEGKVQDLTIRSFGILTASQMPRVRVVIEDDDREPRASGVAVMAATMAAAWQRAGLGSRWPVNREVLA
jgi:aerobic-type carbon monoxide dehydrogenase small subunit (CoxS/CutS family)